MNVSSVNHGGRRGLLHGLILLLILIPSVSAQDRQPPPAPPIPVGPVSVEEVFQHNEEYKSRAESYPPIASGIEFLKNYPRKIRIEVFYGSWCGDSRNHVPPLLKVISAAGNPNIEVAFWAVDRTKTEPAEPIKQRRIVRVPTFIVFDGDHELGRIVEIPTSSIEEDLYRILEPTVRERKEPGATPLKQTGGQGT
ncbi:MAG: thioredoxin family protein [Acidobacteria bacterium]|nr:thioredoxin family protein [Acidobacteriota bacterium]